jgi:hypothetical protein
LQIAMDDIAAQFAMRDNFRRKMQMLKTPEQRMREMDELQQVFWKVLKSNPVEYARFLRRNFKACAIDVRELHGSDVSEQAPSSNWSQDELRALMHRSPE